MPRRRALAPALLALALLGCNQPQPAPQTKPNAEPAQPEQPEQPAPVIASDEPVFEFGTVAPSETVTHVFKLVNRGTADLHIEKVERT